MRRQRRSAALVLGLGVLASAGCQVLVSTDGLEGPPLTTDTAESGTPEGSLDAPEAGTDAPPILTDADAGEGTLRDCVVLLHMEDPSWSDTSKLADGSGRNNAGVVVGTTMSSAAGKFGKAASFDGSSWISVPDSASLHFQSALTYSAWVYPMGLTDGVKAPGILSKRRAFGDNVAFTLFFWSENRAWVDVQDTRVSSKAPFLNATWYHLAVVFDVAAVNPDRRVLLYVNGAEDQAASATAALGPNTEAITIGNLLGGGDSFVGRIDEVAIWARALAPKEIVTLYEAKGPL